MVGREQAASEAVGEHGEPGGLRECAQGVLASRPEHIRADHEDGPVGFGDELGDRRHRVGVGRGAGELVGPGAIGKAHRCRAPGVERDVDERRTTMGCARGAQRRVDESGDLFG